MNDKSYYLSGFSDATGAGCTRFRRGIGQEVFDYPVHRGNGFVVEIDGGVHAVFWLHVMSFLAPPVYRAETAGMNSWLYILFFGGCPRNFGWSGKPIWTAGNPMFFPRRIM